MSQKTKARVLSMIERERHRVAATITQEQEWELPEPNNGLARMFVIMLLIHVFVIGGIIIYDFIGADSTPKSSLISNSITPARSTSIAPSVPVAVPLISQAPLAAPKSTATPTIAQPEAAPVPKALPYIAPAESPYKPVAVTKAALTDPAPRSSDTPAVKAAPASEITPREQEKPKPIADKPAPVAEKAKPVAEKPAPVAEKPAAEIASKSPSQPKPVMTPSEARKALDGDSKTTIAKKNDKDAADAPPAPKKDKEVAYAAPARKKDKEVADASPAHKKDKENADAPPARKKDKEVADSSSARKKDKENADAPPARKKDKEVADASSARKKDKEDADAPPAKKTAKASAAHSASKYTIVKGDTFYSLARRYKTSEDALMKANGIKNANALVLGKTITIPAAK